MKLGKAVSFVSEVEWLCFNEMQNKTEMVLEMSLLAQRLLVGIRLM